MNPALAALYDKNAFTLSSFDLIPEYIGIDTEPSTKCYVSFYVFNDFIEFDMRHCLFNTKNTLSKISWDVIPENRNISFFV